MSVQDGFEIRGQLIRPEIQDLIARGKITPEELKTLRCNSWEWEALIPAMNDEAFCERMQYTLDNCFTRRERPFTTYNQALEGLWAPELLKRFGKYRAVVEFLRGNIPLAETPEEFLRELEEIQKLSIAAKRCQACRIEAEIGTEENPHPVPSRFHTCPPTYQNAEFGVHIFAEPQGFGAPLYERTPDGHINNCALANGDKRENCQVCKEQCPDRGRFEVKP